MQALVSSRRGVWFTRKQLKDYVRANSSRHAENSLNTLIDLCTINNPSRPWPRSGWEQKTYADMGYNILFRHGTDDEYRLYEPASDPKPKVL